MVNNTTAVLLMEERADRLRLAHLATAFLLSGVVALLLDPVVDRVANGHAQTHSDQHDGRIAVRLRL